MTPQSTGRLLRRGPPSRIDGLPELEEGGLQVTLVKAVAWGGKRARELVENQET